MRLPIFQDENKNFMLHQTQWGSVLNPIISLPLNNGILIKDITLVTGSNVINHRLSRKIQGWFVTRMQDSYVQLFDSQNTNQMTDKTLILNSSGSGLIDLFVF